jgi:hypothetical protein
MLYLAFLFLYLTFPFIYLTFSFLYLTFSFLYLTFSFLYLTFSFLYLTFLFLHGSSRGYRELFSDFPRQSLSTRTTSEFFKGQLTINYERLKRSTCLGSRM